MKRYLKEKKQMLGGIGSDERGAVFIFFAISLPVVLGFAALAIDGARMYQTEAELQKTADAAAMAGIARVAGRDIDSEKNDSDDFQSTTCSRYSDDTRQEACQLAIYYAQKNMPRSARKQGNVLIDDGVKFGCWNSSTRKVQSEELSKCGKSGKGPKAIKVITERASGRGDAAEDNPLPLFLARAGQLGQALSNVRASAVAIVEGGSGPAPCFFARDEGQSGGDFILGSNSTLDLPDCALATNGTMNVKGNAKGLQAVAGVTYRNYDAGTGNRRHPSEDFDDPGTVKELGTNENLPVGVKPQDGEELERCNGNSTCNIASGLYIVEGDLQITGKATYAFPSSGESARIYVTGEFKFRGTATMSGCVQISAAKIDINGNPFGSNDGCQSDQTKPFPGTGTQISLVR